MIDLNELTDGEVAVEVGDELQFSLPIQESVGYDPRLSSYDKEVLKLKERKVEREHPEEMTEISGADEGKCIFVLEASSVGETELVFYQTFRGDVEEEYKFRVKVS